MCFHLLWFLSSFVSLLLFCCLVLFCLFLLYMLFLLEPFSYQIYSMYLVFLCLFYLALPHLNLFFFLHMIEVTVFLLDHGVIMLASYRSHILHSSLLYQLNQKIISAICRSQTI